jgi:hypothetical protein
MIRSIIDSFVHNQSMFQKHEHEEHFYHNKWNGGLFLLILLTKLKIKSIKNYVPRIYIYYHVVIWYKCNQSILYGKDTIDETIFVCR